MAKYVADEVLFNEILKYLAARPYAEVSELVAKIYAEAKVVPDSAQEEAEEAVSEAEVSLADENESEEGGEVS